MNRFGKYAAIAALSSLLLSGAAIAQDEHRDDADHRDAHHQAYVKHDEWKKGYHMTDEDWKRGEVVSDYQTYHLRKPPSGYEWRMIDGNYVLAASDSGIITTVVVGRH